MITRGELREIAELKHLSLRNAEKDYLLELLLFFLSDHKRELVFKGGTALYKFHGLNRFSEDLDLDMQRKNFKLNREVGKVLRKFQLLSMNGTQFDMEEHGNETNARFSIRGPLYDGRKESMTRITLNLSSRERPVHHELRSLYPVYNEIPSFDIPVLDANEIAAEKIRCIIERDKPRDIYDLWFLSRRGFIPDVDLVNRKLSLNNATFDASHVVERIVEKRKMWRGDLEGLVIGDLPDFIVVSRDLEEMLLAMR